MRKTKIVCTIGPSSSDKETLKKMILAGMNVARFNMSHGTHESHHQMISALKEARAELGIPTAIMIDTKGPEIRVRQFVNGSVTLLKGANFVLTTKNVLGNEQGASVTLPTFNKIVKPGNKILLNDGLIVLSVKSIEGEDVVCKVLVGGVLSNNKSINIPGVDLDTVYLSDTDKKDILFGINEGADIFSISFVGCAKDVVDVKNFLKKNNYSHAMVCSKIESKKGVDNLDEIIAESDSVMVARGDMGVEIEFEKIPYYQKQIIAKCVSLGKPVITATEMLESMIHNIRPTRAEISDVANAVHDQTSAVMLSGETSAGEYPVLVVETMHKIVESAEKSIDYSKVDFNYTTSISTSIGYASCSLAKTLKAKAIIVATNTGFVANCVCRFRPNVPIIACTPNPHILNQLCLLWGVVPVLNTTQTSTDALLETSRKCAEKTKIVKKGDLVVQTASLVLSENVDKSARTNLVVIQSI